MGKALAAWIMMAGAVAAPAMGPRETVETAVVRVIGLLQGADVAKPESSTTPGRHADAPPLAARAPLHQRSE